MVNLANVIEIKDKVVLQNISLEIPVGRKYKEEVRKKYLLYGKNRINKIL